MGHCIYRRISIAEDNKPDIPDGAARLIIIYARLLYYV